MTSPTTSAADTPAADPDAAGDQRSQLAGTRLSRTLDELRAVTWPTRGEWASYTAIVMVFLVTMTAAVGGVDAGLSALVLHLLG